MDIKDMKPEMIVRQLSDNRVGVIRNVTEDGFAWSPFIAGRPTNHSPLFGPAAYAVLFEPCEVGDECVQCGNPGGDVLNDPYARELESRDVPVRLHPACAQGRI